MGLFSKKFSPVKNVGKNMKQESQWEIIFVKNVQTNEKNYEEICKDTWIMQIE